MMSTIHEHNPYCEAWGWQYHALGVYFCSWDRVTALYVWLGPCIARFWGTTSFPDNDYDPKYTECELLPSGRRFRFSRCRL